MSPQSIQLREVPNVGKWHVMTMHYLQFDPEQGYPRSADLPYECQRCHTLLPSMPKENVYCKCFNIIIDKDAGRIGVQDDSLVRLVQIEQ